MKELTIEEKAKAYDEAIERAKEMCAMPSDKATMEYVFPELKESEEEKVRKDIVVVLESSATKFFKEHGEIPVWYDKAIAYLEKVKDFDKQLDEAYKTADEVQYKRGYGKGYADGMVAAKKKELEKQNEKPATISVDKMVGEFEDFKVISCGRIPSFAEVDAYRKGVTDALSKILIKEEKPITIGSKKAEGKLGEMIAASKKPAKSGEDKELSHKEVSKKSEQDDKWKWDEDDEKFVKQNIYIKLGSIDEVNDELYSKIIDWISLIKRRLS